MKRNLVSAVEDFDRARSQAKLESLLARLTGQSTELLSYEEVRQKLRARERSSEHLEDILLDAIVGSVGRYKDFTRSFLPKQASSRDRWARVEMAVTSLEGVPPIEVYKVGDAFFVRDGNHRVSVARQLGATSIQAYVTEVETKVPLSPDVQPDDLILKAEYAAFLDATGIDEVRPEADLRVTAPGQYQVLEEHIEVHRHFMGLEKERHVPYREAVVHWYDEVYVPVVQLIQQRGILWSFPERTETDLYLWLAEHRAAVEEQLGWEISADVAADDLVERFSQKPGQVLKRMGRRVLEAITPDELELGPPVGQWREQRLGARQDGRLFADILVAINGQDHGWAALDQALIVAQHEGARLQGLHLVSSDDDQESADAQALQAEFDRRCDAAGVEGRLVLDVGPVQRRICDRARWTDLIILSLNYPPGPGPIAKLGSGMTTIIRRCPRPVLTVPGEPSPLRHALLAYDGSPKAREALFVATYVSGRWALPLTVLTVPEGDRAGSEAMEDARGYLGAHGVQADFVTADSESTGTVAESILGVAEEHGCDLILIGGYGHSPAVELVLGSAVDGVLRESRWPTLICR
jgi:nucleotide-binding universal stress UspA family protein